MAGWAFIGTGKLGLADVFRTKLGENARAKTIRIPGNINHLNFFDLFIEYLLVGKSEFYFAACL
jgi:hypothetical protein